SPSAAVSRPERLLSEEQRGDVLPHLPSGAYGGDPESDGLRSDLHWLPQGAKASNRDCITRLRHLPHARSRAATQPEIRESLDRRVCGGQAAASYRAALMAAARCSKRRASAGLPISDSNS